MATFAIDLETSPALLALSDLKRSQLPFATAVALTKTAKAAQAEIRSQLPERFTIRSAFVERGVRIEAATKNRQQAAVFWRGPSGSRFAESLARQETGGVKRPAKRFLALPRNVKRGASGAVPKSQRPAALLRQKRVFTQDVAGGKVILRRVSKDAPPRLLFFLMERPAQIPPRFRFRETAANVARRTYRKEFGRAFAKAIATRKR